MNVTRLHATEFYCTSSPDHGRVCVMESLISIVSHGPSSIAHTRLSSAEYVQCLFYPWVFFLASDLIQIFLLHMHFLSYASTFHAHFNFGALLLLNFVRIMV